MTCDKIIIVSANKKIQRTACNAAADFYVSYMNNWGRALVIRYSKDESSYNAISCVDILASAPVLKKHKSFFI